MTRATPTRWAPHWQTIDGVVYMTETGGSHYLDPLNLLFGQYQVGYKERRDEDGMLLTGDITQKHTGMNSVEITGSDESDFIRLEKDAHSVVDGGAGNDTIKGGRVSDVIRGGTGNDYVRGGGGDDQVSAAPAMTGSPAAAAMTSFMAELAMILSSAAKVPTLCLAAKVRTFSF